LNILKISLTNRRLNLDIDKTIEKVIDKENNMETQKERVVLVGLADTNIPDSQEETIRSVEELGLLAQTAGAEVVGSAIQQRHGVDSKTFIGKGKLAEIANACEELGADTIIFDDELTGSQMKNIEEVTGLKIIDRTFLILDIFAQRAKSKEGKLQVELAQQKYRYQRLTGLGTSLSRLGGGIGTRGPGETKLESDRRHINRRIDYLKKQIQEIGVRRERIRSVRKDKEAVVIAVVGYTNAGKSTIINKLSGSDLFAENMLFATLDATARSVELPEGDKAILVDTVGFIRKLPHHLIEAFKSTLEELSDADIIMHVIDSSDYDWQRHSNIVEELMDEFKCASKPRITVFNKIDIPSDIDLSSLSENPAFNNREGLVLSVSSLTGEGMENLKTQITKQIRTMKTRIKLVLPYDKVHLLDYIRTSGTLENVEYKDDGVYATAYMNASGIYPLEKYISSK